MSRIEKNISGIARPELQPVAALQFLPLDALTVDEGAVLTAQVNEEEVWSFLHDLGVIARDAGISDDQVLIDLPPHAEGSAVQDDVLLLTTLNEDKGGKDSGTGAVMTDRVQGHEGAAKHTVGANRSTDRTFVKKKTTLTACLPASTQVFGMPPLPQSDTCIGLSVPLGLDELFGGWECAARAANTASAQIAIGVTNVV